MSGMRRAQGVRSLAARFRWIYLAPVLAFVALGAWAFASPIGASPDDDYHLISIWCANGGSEYCEPGTNEGSRLVPATLPAIQCYAQHEERSAACQEQVWEQWNAGTVETYRGDFVGSYPPIYYSVMHLFAGADIQVSALAMRLFNAALFVGLATALMFLLPAVRRSTLLWGWLVTLVPLGMFIIPSNNPSGWAVTGVGTAFLALLGWFDTDGRRRWGLGILYAIGTLMAAGARGDAAVYVIGATIVVLILTARPTREWALRALLALGGILFAIVMFLSARQSGMVSQGFPEGGAVAPVLGDPTGAEASLSGIPLAAYNLLMLPLLWTGAWGTWGLGWLDTQMPAIVPWAAAAAFVVVAFAGLGNLDWRKAITATGVLIVLVALPVYLLTISGDMVGENLQPRYVLPLMVLLVMILLTTPAGRATMRFTRVQTIAILGALALAHLVALQINIRRYVTGADQQGFNLDAGAEWWWSGFPLGPTALWVVGVLAYVALLAVIWPQLRSRTAPVARPGAIATADR